jgi:hypothetical protein
MGQVTFQLFDKWFLQGMNVAHVHNAACSNSRGKVAQNGNSRSVDLGELEASVLCKAFSQVQTANFICADQKKMWWRNSVGSVASTNCCSDTFWQFIVGSTVFQRLAEQGAPPASIRRAAQDHTGEGFTSRCGGDVWSCVCAD